jgi:hypothetical protein
MSDKLTIRTQDLAFVASITKGLGGGIPGIGIGHVSVADGVVTYKLHRDITITHPSKAHTGPPMTATFSAAMLALKTAQALELGAVAITAEPALVECADDEPKTVDQLTVSTHDLLSVLPFAPAKDHRRVLMGVHVVVSDEERHATATCGKKLGRRLIDVVGDTARGFRCWVPRELLVLLEKASSAKGVRVGDLDCRTDGDGKAMPETNVFVAKVKRVGCAHLTIKSVRKHAGKWPDADAIIKQASKFAGFEITDVGALRGLLKRINPVICPKNHAITFNAKLRSASFVDACGDSHVVKGLPLEPLSGKEGHLAFNSVILLSLLPDTQGGIVQSATITGGQNGPCFLEWDGCEPGEVTLLMPIKLADLRDDQEVDAA